jgi:hypothetical protein
VSGRRIEDGVEEVDGRGEAAPGCGRPAAGSGKKGGGLEVEGGADRWAPPVGDRVREGGEGGGGAGRVGLKRSWAAAGRGWVDRLV